MGKVRDSKLENQNRKTWGALGGVRLGRDGMSPVLRCQKKIGIATRETESKDKFRRGQTERGGVIIKIQRYPKSRGRQHRPRSMRYRAATDA